VGYLKFRGTKKTFVGRLRRNPQISIPIRGEAPTAEVSGAIRFPYFRPRKLPHPARFPKLGVTPETAPNKRSASSYPYINRVLMAAENAEQDSGQERPPFDSSTTLPCNSHSTAIAVLLPVSLHNDINVLRSVYDKSYPRWAPHITVAIPFVGPADLALAMEQIRTLFKDTDLLRPWDITFSSTAFFPHKDSATVYLQPDEASE
jgi:hypothetical protein